MRTGVRHFLLMLLAAWLAGGCELATSELMANYSLSLDGARLHVAGYFADAAEDDSVDLGDDRVVVTFRGREYRLEGGKLGYETWIDLDAPLVADEPVSLALLRDGEADARSTIELPPLLQVDPVPLFVERSEPLTLTWSPITDDEMYWYMDLFSCVRGSGEIPPGTGTLTIPAGTLAGHHSGACTANLTLRRVRIRPVDPVFAEGSIYFVDESTLQFASTP